MKLPGGLCRVLLASCAFARVAASAPLLSHSVEDITAELRSHLQRRQASLTAITGIQEFGVQPRLEIRQLEQNTDQWNIFLLGLARFQGTNQSEKLSYYQIAGRVANCATVNVIADTLSQASTAGHTFPGMGLVQLTVKPTLASAHMYQISSCPGIDHTWHSMRHTHWPLSHWTTLTCMQQVLFTHIVDAVNTFPAGFIRQRYAAAALSWRHPYWDWAAVPPSSQSVLPSSITSPNVTVTLPNGAATIPNPLFEYRFHPVRPDDFYFDPFASWNQTMRYPTAWSSDAVSQNSLIGPILDNNRVSFADRLYNLFTNYNNFTEFGNEAWLSPAVSNADSLESVHDVIHSITGSNGHMTFLDYSAFDPIFFLHHTMIDRIFAMWQVIYNDSYVEPMAAIEQTFAIPIGQVMDVNSPLEPFHNDSSGSFWTPAGVRSIRALGYTYADIGKGSSAVVKQAVNRLYGNTAGSGSLPRRHASPAKQAQRHELPPATSQVNAREAVTYTGAHREFIANILSPKSALNGSYAIYLFLGDFGDDPSTWATDPNLVGTHAVFAALKPWQLGRINVQASNLKVTGALPLTSMLLAKVEAAQLASMEVSEVTQYLQENLAWRVGMVSLLRRMIQEAWR